MVAQIVEDGNGITIVCDEDVENIISSTVAIVRYQGEHGLYDIGGQRIVERSPYPIGWNDGYILSSMPEGGKKHYRLYTKMLKPVREWSADSCILFQNDILAIRNEEEWSIIDAAGTVVYRTRRRIRNGCFPFIVLDSANSLVDTRTNEILLDSVESIMPWGRGAVVEVLRENDYGSKEYHWLDFASKRRIDLGYDVKCNTDNDLIAYYWTRRWTVFDTNMVIRCKLDRAVVEYNDSVRVEYSNDDQSWCIIDLIGDRRQCGYRYVVPDGKGFYLVIHNLQWGLIRYDGKVIIPMCEPIYRSSNPKQHSHVVWLPNFSADNVIRSRMSYGLTISYYYDDTGYHRLFPD